MAVRPKWPLRLAYDAKLVPAGGPSVAGSFAAPIKETTKELAGYAYHRKQLLAAGLAVEGAPLPPKPRLSLLKHSLRFLWLSCGLRSAQSSGYFLLAGDDESSDDDDDDSEEELSECATAPASLSPSCQLPARPWRPAPLARACMLLGKTSRAQ